jgi:hypothetical protein
MAKALGVPCERPGWARRGEVEGAIWRALEAGQEALREAAEAAGDGPDDAEILDAEIADLRSQAERLADAIATMPDSAALVTKLQKVEAELSSLVVKKATIPSRDSLSSLSIKAYEIVRKRNPAAMRILVHRIELGPKGQGWFKVWTAHSKSARTLKLGPSAKSESR